MFPCRTATTFSASVSILHKILRQKITCLRQRTYYLKCSNLVQLTYGVCFYLQVITYLLGSVNGAYDETREAKSPKPLFFLCCPMKQYRVLE